eukprot:TRINITY_DN8915_c0_g1_i5.p1 TRINITY_DN8915_c0_g1~~TRINITY_DN8915_c0_g1_i5.p1  ORF type:complete len:472 (+),score=47.79 TRINITY_DN8915_c0_g1_i5:111-1418(+)
MRCAQQRPLRGCSGGGAWSDACAAASGCVQSTSAHWTPQSGALPQLAGCATSFQSPTGARLGRRAVRRNWRGVRRREAVRPSPRRRLRKLRCSCGTSAATLQTAAGRISPHAGARRCCCAVRKTLQGTPGRQCWPCASSATCSASPRGGARRWPRTGARASRSGGRLRRQALRGSRRRGVSARSVACGASAAFQGCRGGLCTERSPRRRGTLTRPGRCWGRCVAPRSSSCRTAPDCALQAAEWTAAVAALQRLDRAPPPALDWLDTFARLATARLRGVAAAESRTRRAVEHTERELRAKVQQEAAGHRRPPPRGPPSAGGPTSPSSGGSARPGAPHCPPPPALSSPPALPFRQLQRETSSALSSPRSRVVAAGRAGGGLCRIELSEGDCHGVGDVGSPVSPAPSPPCGPWRSPPHPPGGAAAVQLSSGGGGAAAE